MSVSGVDVSARGEERRARIDPEVAASARAVITSSARGARAGRGADPPIKSSRGVGSAIYFYTHEGKIEHMS